MVGHSGAGLQPELCDEAAGVGRTVGEQASQGSALRPDRPSGPGDATRQEADHPSGAGPSLIRVVDQGTSEDIGAVRRAVPTISGPVCASVEGDSARSPRLGHAFFGLRTAIIGAATLPIPSKSSAKVLPTARSDHMEPPNRYSTRRKFTKATPTMLGGESGSVGSLVFSGPYPQVQDSQLPQVAYLRWYAPAERVVLQD